MKKLYSWPPMVATQLLLLFAVFFPFPALAQVSIPERPISFATNQAGRQQPFTRKTFALGTTIDNQAVLQRAQARADRQHSGISPYGTGIPTSIDVIRDAQVNELPDGGKVWLLEIGSSTAYGLQLHFNRMRLPEGARLFMYTPDHSMVLGAYTKLNNNENGEFAIQILKGDKLILEYYEPPQPEFPGELKINRVIHAFRDVFGGTERAGFGEAQACNININCEPSFTEEAKAVARYSLYDPFENISGFASGAMINSISVKPYFLTAYHCLSPVASVNQYFSSWIFYFNYEFPGCASSAIEPNNTQTIQGAYLRSRGKGSDYLLMELSSNPKQSYAVNYLGWDANGYTPNSGVAGIHHPSGDVKKIALLYSNSPTRVKTETNADDTFSEVAGFPETDFKLSWDEGVTWAGSSGSPLIDFQSRRILGQLHGGNSICSGSSVNYNGPDYYGMFALSWQNPDSGFPTLKSLLTSSSSSLMQLDGDYNGGPVSIPTVTITDIVLATNKFSPPDNKLTPTIVTTGNTGTLTYSWSPAADFTHPNLSYGVINFGLTYKPTLPLTRTYTLTVTPQNGQPTSRSITVTLYDCTNKTFSKFVHLNTDVYLGDINGPGETYTWSPATNLSSSTIQDPVFKTSAIGEYKYVMTATSAGCTRKETYNIYADETPTPSGVNTTVVRQAALRPSPTWIENYAIWGALQTSTGWIMPRNGDAGAKLDVVSIDVMNHSFGVISSKTFSTSVITKMDKIVKSADGGYVAFGNKNYRDSYSNMVSYQTPIALKLDASFNVVWRYEGQVNSCPTTNPATSCHCTYEGGIQDEDGSWLLIRQSSNNGPPWDYTHFQSLERLSPTGQLIQSIALPSTITTASKLISPTKFLVAETDAMQKIYHVLYEVTSAGGASQINLVWRRPALSGDFIILEDGSIMNSRNSGDYIIVNRIGSDGTTLWEKRYTGKVEEFGFYINQSRIIRTTDGNFFVMGSIQSSAGGHKSEDGRGGSDVWILKISGDGVLLGDISLGGSSGEYDMYRAGIAPNGNYYFVNRSYSPVSKDKTVYVQPLDSYYPAHFWYVEFQEGGACTTPQAVITSSSGSTVLCNSNITLSGNSGSDLLYRWYRDGIQISQSRTITVTTDNPGNYKLVLYKANACYTEATVEVRSLVASITTSGPLCSGSSTTLTANVNSIGPLAYSYKWQEYRDLPLVGWTWVDISSASSITVSKAAKYRVKVTAGCTSTSPELNLTALSNPKPTISYSGDVCTNNYLTLTSSLGSSYLWSNGSTARTINGYAGGSFYVTVVNSNGCTNTSSSFGVPYCQPTDPCDQISIANGRVPNEPCNEQLQLTESSIKAAVAYPNPAKGKLTIRIPQNAEADTPIQMVNQFGQMVKSQVLFKGTDRIEFDVEDLTNGVYLVQINNNVTLKVLIVQ